MSHDDHDDIEELLPGYVLDALDPPEREQVAQHLRICPRCQIVAESGRVVVETLGFAATQYRPSPVLKAQLMARVASEPAPAAPRPSGAAARPHVPWRGTALRSMRVPLWLPAAAVVSWLLVAGLGVMLLKSLQGTPSPSLVVAALRGPHGETGRLAMVAGGTSAFLMLTHMPALPHGKSYVCWLRRRGRMEMERIAAFGLMKNADDAAMALHTPHSLEDYTSIGVSMEAAPYPARPTGTILAWGSW